MRKESNKSHYFTNKPSTGWGYIKGIGTVSDTSLYDKETKVILATRTQTYL